MGSHVADVATRRRQTVFERCAKHATRFASCTRRRCAVVFVEGGPAGSPCQGGLCQMKPGTDFYSTIFVDAYPVYTGAVWEPNRLTWTPNPK